MFNYDNPFKGTGNYFRMMKNAHEWGTKRAKKRQLKKDLAAFPYMPHTVGQCHQLVENNAPYEQVIATLAHDREAQERKKKQDAFLASPPKIHGSAKFDTEADMKANEIELVHDFAICPEIGNAIYLGGLDDGTPKGAFPRKAIFWQGESHLLTIAPTRTGKSLSLIVPNLLRYQGSAVVLDPKGELFKATSKWRDTNVGRAYLLNPFNLDGLDGFTHTFNPLDLVQSDEDAKLMAEQFYPRAETQQKKETFFDDEAREFLTAAIWYFANYAPEDQRNFASLRDQLAGLRRDSAALFDRMEAVGDPMLTNRVAAFRAKDLKTGIPRLSDTLEAKLSIFDGSGIRKATTGNSTFRFEELKDKPATVYIAFPFDNIDANAVYVNLIMGAAIRAMTRNPRRPETPVLFVLDEFLALPPAIYIVDALRTHAGAGARLWFFLQDMAALKDKYPTTAASFFQAEVECYFGTDDHETAKHISDMLGSTTAAYLGSSETGTTGGSAHYSYNESVQLAGRSLMTPDEVQRFMAYPPAPLIAQKSRAAIIKLRGATLKARLSPYFIDPLAKTRVGSIFDKDDSDA